MYSAAPEAVPPAPCREYCFPPYDGFFLLPSYGSYILGDNQLSILFIAVLYILFVRLWEARHTELQPIPALHEWALPSDE